MILLQKVLQIYLISLKIQRSVFVTHKFDAQVEAFSFIIVTFFEEGRGDVERRQFTEGRAGEVHQGIAQNLYWKDIYWEDICYKK